MIPADKILSECVAQSVAQIDLTGEDGAAGIIDTGAVPARSNVFAIGTPYTRDSRERFPDWPRPSLNWSVLKTRTPPSGGDNLKSIVFYTVLAQIIDTDFDILDTAKLKSRQKWDHNIRRYINMGNLRNEVNSATEGMVTLAYIDDADLLDERLFHGFDDALVSIPVTFKCYEPHVAAGRV